MKRQLFGLILACGSACMAATTLQAQSFATIGEIPFAFHVGKTTLPAGRYKVSQDLSSPFQSVRNMTTGKTVMVGTMGNTVDNDKRPRLLFHQYGGQYFLSEIWSPYGTASRVIMGAAERQVRQQMTSANQESVNVPLVAHR